jgi:phosphopantothenoylcysteine decarboxylase/phosphopantothenate--cysteine ligase
MGIALAKELQARGADVTLVLGPVAEVPDLKGIRILTVKTAAEMYAECMTAFPGTDLAVMAAAVADYTPAKTAEEKIKKTEESLPLELIKTKDILKSLGAVKSDKQVLVGFALETNNEKQHALAKLETKNADIIVLNSMKDAGAGFGTDTNKVTLFTRDGQEFSFGVKSKQAVAADITDIIIKLYYAS